MATSLSNVIEYKKNTFINANKSHNLSLSYHYILLWDWKDTGKEMDKSISSVKYWF